MSERALRPWAELSKRRAFGAGFAAAAAAIAVGELVSGLSGQALSPLSGLGKAFIELAPDRLLLRSIAVLQHMSKPVLIGSILTVILLIGGLLGLRVRRSGIVTIAGLGVGVVVVALALARDPRVSIVGAVSITTVVGAVAVVVFLLLASSPVTRSQRPSQTSEAPDMHQRRHMIRALTVTALSLFVIGSVGWSYWLQRRIRDEASFASIPRARHALPAVAHDATINAPGISPLFTSNDRFYRIDVALTIPHVDLATWRLGITGMVDRPLSLSYDDLVSLPLAELDATLCCVSNEVGGGLVGTARWTGVRLRDLLEAARADPNASQIIGRSLDGWTAGFRTQEALEVDALVAVGMNGETLPTEHGFPARVVVPGLYGYASATKWLQGIEMSTWEAFDGYWVQRGWGKEGRIVIQSRIDAPRWGATLTAGRVRIVGVAWAPPQGVNSVEVRVDDGSWQNAELGTEVSPYTWRQWRVAWDALPGSHFIEVRAIDSKGQAQTSVERRPEPDGATGLHRVRVEVI